MIGQDKNQDIHSHTYVELYFSDYTTDNWARGELFSITNNLTFILFYFEFLQLSDNSQVYCKITSSEDYGSIICY